MQQGDRIVGRVIRVGRGWADVAVGNKVRRVSVRPDLLIRAGSQLILNRKAASRRSCKSALPQAGRDTFLR